jgi:hypothetical protein
MLNRFLVFIFLFASMLVFTACGSKRTPIAQSHQPNQRADFKQPIVTETDTLLSDSTQEATLKRKVLKFGSPGDMAIKRGKIVVHICIDQSGKVISAEFDSVESSASHARFASRAEEVARDYVFEASATAPERECGKLTYIFKMGR